MNNDAFGTGSASVTGMAATLVGLLLALSIFPDSPTPRGALTLPAVILTAGIAFVPIVRGVRRVPTMVNAENFVALGFMFWLLLDLIQGAYELNGAQDWAIRDAFIAIGVSAFTMWAGVGGKPWPLPKWLNEIAVAQIDNRTLGRLIIACFLLGMFNFALSTGFNIPLMFSYIGAQRWAAPWGRGQLGGWDAFLDQMQYFGYLLPSLTALLISRRGFRGMTWVGLICSAIMLAFLAQGGGRRIIGVTGGAAILVWILSNPGLPIRRLIVAASLAGVLLGTMQFMLNIRSQGYEEYLYRGQSEYDYLHVDDNFLRLAQVIQIVPAEFPFVEYKQLWFTIIRPIPRVFWPGKPIDPGFDLPSIVGLKGVSLSTSIIGEWYLTWGWIAVAFGGWLHGRLARTADQLHEDPRYKANPIVYGLTVMVLVSGMRSMQDLVIMSYALVAWWAANRLTRERAIGTR